MTDAALGDLIGTLGSIDPDAIDWPHVQRTTSLIHQHLRYEYPGPIRDLRQRLMIVPPDFLDGQRLVTHKLRTSGCDVDIERSYDTFGNVVLDLGVQEVEHAIDFTAWIVVEREALLEGGPDEPEPVYPDPRLLQPTPLTEADDALMAVADAAEATGLTGEALADEICRRVHEHFRYEFGITTVRSTAAEAWAGGVGVCQDYAHCMAAIARLCGLPTRYVSGHLLGEGGTHAWVEVLVPHPSDPDVLRAVPIDPTHDRRAGLKYLTVSVGRDYLDVLPTSGTYDAPHAGELTTHKRAAVTRVEYLRPRRRRPPRQLRTG